jgi:hypothetical protein
MQDHERANALAVLKTVGEGIGGIIGDHIPMERRAEVAADLGHYLQLLEGFAQTGAPIFFGKEVVTGAIKALGFEPVK